MGGLYYICLLVAQGLEGIAVLGHRQPQAAPKRVQILAPAAQGGRVGDVCNWIAVPAQSYGRFPSSCFSFSRNALS